MTATLELGLRFLLLLDGDPFRLVWNFLLQVLYVQGLLVLKLASEPLKLSRPLIRLQQQEQMSVNPQLRTRRLGISRVPA